MSETPTPVPERLFPLGKIYKLESGVTIEVRKWNIETMVRVSQLVPRAFDKFQKVEPGTPVTALIPTMIDDIKLIVAETIGWDVTRVDREMSGDDFLGVTTVVWDECVAGPLAKSLGLTKRFMNLLASPVAVPAQSPTPKTLPSPSSNP